MYLMLAMKCRTAIMFVPHMNVAMNIVGVREKEQLKKARSE